MTVLSAKPAFGMGKDMGIKKQEKAEKCFQLRSCVSLICVKRPNVIPSRVAVKMKCPRGIPLQTQDLPNIWRFSSDGDHPQKLPTDLPGYQEPPGSPSDNRFISRAGFLWGVGSSAYQTEGAWDKDGKGPSIWDAFTHKKGKVFRNETGDSACDGYYKVKAEIQLLKELKVNHYLFSISWPRIMPTGIKEQLNEKGIQFYNDTINSLLENNITPIVSLYHWDLPQTHAKVWHSYNNTWRSEQQGMVGISLTSSWGEPVDPHSQTDRDAAERYIQFHLGWFANPIYRGDYPEVMKNYVGRKSAQQGLETSRLPTFSVQEKTYIKGTSDFLGIGHFTTRYVIQKSFPFLQVSSYHSDQDSAELVDPKWAAAGPSWLYSVPWGFRRLLNFIKTQYGNPLIYVTENGVSEKVQRAQLCDEWRIEYLKGYINEILKALNDGVNVKGYTAWSLLDKFEWNKGFSERFGFYHVDFKNKNKPRYPKASVDYYKNIISANGFPNPREVENWHKEAMDTCSATHQLLATDSLLTRMEMLTEIVLPTALTLCILTSIVLLIFYLRSHH
ncbi:Lctl [Columba guinea]|nr:Lctl [Columba guinea]